MAEDSPTVVFETNDVTKVYHMGEVSVHALRGVDIQFFEGEFVVLLGRSGSGKSTLLNILGGLDVSFRRRRHLSGSAHGGIFGERTHRLSARPCRVRLPVLQPDPQPYRAGKRRPGHRDRARSDESRGRPRARRPRATGSIISRPRCPAANSNASPSPGPSPSNPMSCSATNPPAPSISTPASRCWRRLQSVNRELGTTTAVITHNAVISDMAHRVITLSDGQIESVRSNETRKRASELEW